MFLGACGGGGGTPTVRSPASTSSTTTSLATATTAPAKSNPPTTARQKQTLIVTPATSLAAKQQVSVIGSGFSANEPLVLTQCADKGTATGMGDCNLAAMQTVTSDASGRVQATVAVVVGPFGSNNIVCGTTQPCLISLTQATPSPTEEADAPISFR